MVGGSLNEDSDRSTHSGITMDSTSRHSGMAELEAELEVELELMEQNLIAEYSSDRTFSDSEMMDTDSMIDAVHEDLDISGIPYKNVPQWKNNNIEREAHLPSYGVSPTELSRRLHELLERRREEQIEELKANLKNAQEKLLAKEMELSWWKERALKLLKQSDLPGNNSIASTSTEEESNGFYACNLTRDNVIQEKGNLYDLGSLSSSLNLVDNLARMKDGDQDFFDIEINNGKACPFDNDWKIINNSQSKRDPWSKNVLMPEFPTSDTEQCVETPLYCKDFTKVSDLKMDVTTQRVHHHANSKLKYSQQASYRNKHPLQTVYRNDFVEKGKGKYTERKENRNIPIYARRKVACLQELKDHHPACHPELKVYKKIDPAHPCFNTPAGSCKAGDNTQTHPKLFQNVLQTERCEHFEGYERPKSPVVEKIRHWEALSKGKLCALGSSDVDNLLLSSRADHDLVSFTDNFNGNGRELATKN